MFYKFNIDEKPNDDLLKLANFFGKVCAKAFLERIPVPMFLNHTITRHLLGQALKMEDLFTYDKHVKYLCLLIIIFRSIAQYHIFLKIHYQITTFMENNSV